MHLHKHVLSQSHHTCHHFATNLCTVWDFPTHHYHKCSWISLMVLREVYSWGQRKPWVQLAALAATWYSAPWSGGQNPRKLCQLGARIKGIGASAVGSGWHVGWDETTTRLFKPVLSQTLQFVGIYCICIHSPYQTGAELCPSSVTPFYSDVQIPP